MTPDLDVAVVGGGIAGLTTAYELRRAGLTVRVFEQAPHVGGRMSSVRHQGWTIDQGAEQVPGHGYRATWELLARLGVPRSDVPQIGAGVGMWRDGRVRPGVADPSALFNGGAGLSPRARADLVGFLAGIARKRRAYDTDHPEDTPLGSATVRELSTRYHSDLHDYLLQPVAGAFFGWDTARSAAAPMAGLLAEAGPPSGWRTYRDGMDLPARRLAETVDVVTGRAVREVVDEGGHARIRFDDGEVTARAAVLSVPAPLASALRPEAPEDEREFLAACTFSQVLKVSCLLDEPLTLPAPRPLYILLTPAAEEDVLSAVIVDHVKHPGRAPRGKGLLTLLASSRTTAEFLAAGEEATGVLVAAAERYVPGLRAATRRCFAHPIPHALPEATPAALRGRARFASRPARAVEYAGDWVMLQPASEGAVRSATLAASRVLSRLGTLRPVAANPKSHTEARCETA